MVRLTGSGHTTGKMKKEDMRGKDLKMATNTENKHMEHETRAGRASSSTEAASRGGKNSAEAE